MGVEVRCKYSLKFEEELEKLPRSVNRVKYGEFGKMFWVGILRFTTKNFIRGSYSKLCSSFFYFFAKIEIAWRMLTFTRF